jgi:hypothetical protein
MKRLIHKKLPMVVILTALLLCSSTMAFSAAVSISSSGNGVFDLQGSGFVGVAGAKITISYDTGTLANPRVVQGGLMSGAMMAVNTNSPGTIVLALVSTVPFTGNGSIATISFDLPGSSLGSIQSLAADLYGTTGSKAVAQPLIYNPTGTRTQDTTGLGTKSPDTKGDQQKTDTTTSPTSSSGGTSTPVVGGTVSMPGDAESTKGEPKGKPATESASKQKEVQGGPEAGESGDNPAAGAVSAKETAKKTENRSIAYPAVLERFRTYSGTRTVQALVAVFDRNDMPGISQEPSVVLSDGTTHVAVYINLPEGGKDAPNFAFRGAKYLSLKMAGENSWVVELLPDKGTTSAAVKILLNGAITEIPLAVAPPLPREAKIGKGGKLTETDFMRFLKEKGSVKVPMFDLNGDGTRDYIDDYIFTANYIVAGERGKKEKVKEPK